MKDYLFFCENLILETMICDTYSSCEKNMLQSTCPFSEENIQAYQEDNVQNTFQSQNNSQQQNQQSFQGDNSQQQNQQSFQQGYPQQQNQQSFQGDNSQQQKNSSVQGDNSQQQNQQSFQQGYPQQQNQQSFQGDNSQQQKNSSVQGDNSQQQNQQSFQQGYPQQQNQQSFQGDNSQQQKNSSVQGDNSQQQNQQSFQQGYPQQQNQQSFQQGYPQQQNQQSFQQGYPQQQNQQSFQQGYPQQQNQQSFQQGYPQQQNQQSFQQGYPQQQNQQSFQQGYPQQQNYNQNKQYATQSTQMEQQNGPYSGDRRQGGSERRKNFSRQGQGADSGEGIDAIINQLNKNVESDEVSNSSLSSEAAKIKAEIFTALLDTVDIKNMSNLSKEEIGGEVKSIVLEIMDFKSVSLSNAEKQSIIQEIIHDITGYGPLESLLSRDDIADIMINGAKDIFIEVDGKVKRTSISFRDNTQLLNVCQRIVGEIGRRVDEASPICDARLSDGSRVNVIAPPLSIDGPSMTIRKFKKEKLTLKDLVKFNSISDVGGKLLAIIGACRCNIIISGGTGSGKTTLLNCLTGFIARDERIITCEDAAELQLQQPHVVRLETRPPNLEGKGKVTMQDLVKNCLRMRPERIIVGEVRGSEAFDLLQAMNTGHDGSMGTLHANSPRESLSRLESMITMGGFSLPSRTIREMIAGSVDIIVQASRLRDGTRKITHITEVTGMEQDIITSQDILLYEIQGEKNGKISGQHQVQDIIKPKFFSKAEYFGFGAELSDILDS